MSIENQRIGRKGEKLFSLLCTEAGVSCNKSIEDDYGWDMLIEFPPPPQQRGPIDLRPVQLTASVQVKATRTRSRSCRVSLQNALRMAKSPIPSFLFLAHIKEGKSPNYFVVHVWEDRIRDWLKVAREADARGVTAMNKEYVTVQFDAGDEHTDDALPWIEDQIRSVGPLYAATKLKIADTVGFEKGYGIANVSLELNDPKEFIDFQLGLIPKLKASRFQFHSERFGIRAAHPELDLKDVELTLKPEGTPCTLCFKIPARRRLAVPALLFHAIGPDNDATARAWRVKSRCFDIIFSPKGMKANASIKFSEHLPMDDVAAFVALQATTSEKPIKAEIEVGEREISLATIAQEEGHSPVNWANLDFAIESLREISTSAAKPAPELSIARLNEAASELHVLSALASDRTMLLKFTPYPDAPHKFRWLLAYSIATVGALRFAAVVCRPITSDKRHAARRSIYFGPAKLLSSYAGPDKNISEETVLNNYQEQLDDLSTDGEILALGNLRRFVGVEVDHDIRCDRPRNKT